mmetsp:Transcript_30078/g.51182  ORF Transcript_30078/g.51182 Transcript_30078/m.51182 type:complete len:84 (-) Transcript_30078:2-253(-)
MLYALPPPITHFEIMPLTVPPLVSLSLSTPLSLSLSLFHTLSLQRQLYFSCLPSLCPPAGSTVNTLSPQKVRSSDELIIMMIK